MGIGSPRLRQRLRNAVATALAIVTAAAVAGSGTRAFAAPPAATAAVAPSIRAATPVEQAFVAAINTARGREGTPPVRQSGALQRAARAHSADMIVRDYLGHGDFARRLARFGAHGPRLGEALGWYTDPATAVSSVVGAWIRSPVHRAILLRRGFRAVGIGVAIGVFRGHAGTLVVTADFEGV